MAKKRYTPMSQFLMMLAMYRRNRPVLAQEIGCDIEEATGEKIVRPNLYKTLQDLVAKNWANQVPVYNELDGRRRHSFELSEAGTLQVELMAGGLLMLGVLEPAEQGRKMRSVEIEPGLRALKRARA